MSAPRRDGVAGRRPDAGADHDEHPRDRPTGRRAARSGAPAVARQGRGSSRPVRRAPDAAPVQLLARAARRPGWPRDVRKWMATAGLDWFERRAEGATGRSHGMSQFGRALAQLNIDIICANSPQAKGRVERVHKTLQDRLVKELRLHPLAQPHGSLQAEDVSRRAQQGERAPRPQARRDPRVGERPGGAPLRRATAPLLTLRTRTRWSARGRSSRTRGLRRCSR